ASPMHMIRKCFDVVINIGVEMRSRLTMVMASLRDMEQMRNYARFHDALAMLVEIYAPGIAGAFAEKLEDMFGGMIPPDAGIDGRAFVVGRPGLADFRMGKY